MTPFIRLLVSLKQNLADVRENVRNLVRSFNSEDAEFFTGSSIILKRLDETILDATLSFNSLGLGKFFFPEHVMMKKKINLSDIFGRYE